MYYEWTGTWGIVGLGSSSWAGNVKYIYESTTNFSVEYYDSFNGEADYFVDNETRLITSSSILWDNVHDFIWIYNNLSVYDSVLIRNPWTYSDSVFIIQSETQRTVFGKTYNCSYLTGPDGSYAYYDNVSGLLIEGSFRTVQFGYTYYFNYQISKSNAPNNYPPELLNGIVSPTQGNTTTIFQFEVNYTDSDDIEPEEINVIIDGSVYPMSKKNLTDNDYVSGVIYIYQTPLTNTTHSYYFNASDYRFSVNTSEFIGPDEISKMTDNPPGLNQDDLYPFIGHTGTKFRFRVNYSDPDNDIPDYVNVTINGTTLTMDKLDQYDNNYIDGVIYETFCNFSIPGNYFFYFNASDGSNIIGHPSTNVSGPVVWAPYPASSPLFDGAYLNYTGGWTGYENYTYVFGNNFSCYSYTSIGGLDNRNVNNATRFFTSNVGIFGNNSYEWTWIFTNVSLTDVIPIAIRGGDYRNYTVTGETTKNRMGQTFNCWELTDIYGSRNCYDKNLGIFIEGDLGDTSTTIKYIIATNIPDFYAPTLTNGTVTPLVGNLSTDFKFSVNYTDADNNPPVYQRVVINSVPFPMIKEDSGDINYTDGCIYSYSSLLQNISYSFYFEASDNRFNVRYPASSEISGPIVNRANTEPAVLGGESLLPKYVTKYDTYEFKINYTDPENISPEYVNITIFKDGLPNATYGMTETDPSDFYYVNGKEYSISLMFDIGNYEYYFETNDSKFVTVYPSSSNFTDLVITPAKTPIFDGLYYNYYIGMYMGYWGEGTVTYTQLTPTTFNCTEVKTMHIVGTVTVTTWFVVDNRSRVIVDSIYPSDVGKKDHNLIWDNARIGTITELKGENMLYQNYEVIGEANISAMGDEFECWHFKDGNNDLYFEKNTGMFIYTYSNIGMGYSISKTITATNLNFTIPEPPQVIDIITPQNITYGVSSIPVISNNYTYYDQVWVRNQTGGAWSNNVSLQYNGSHWVNVTNLRWSEGVHKLQLFANDSLDDVIERNVTFTIDTQLPNVSITSPTSDGTFLTGNIIQIQGIANGTGTEITQLLINDTFSLTLDPRGSPEGPFTFSNSSALSDGFHCVNITVFDTAGLTHSELRTFYVDNVPPELTCANLRYQGDAQGGNIIEFRGMANGTFAPIQNLSINDSRFTLVIDPIGSFFGIYRFTNNTDLVEGPITVNLTINDEVGMNYSLIIDCILDFTPPSAPTNFQSSVQGNNIALTWNPVTDLTNVTYLIYRNDINIFNVTGISCSDLNLPTGTYVYKIQAIDNAGNLGAASEIEVLIAGTNNPFILFLIFLIVSGVTIAIIAIVAAVSSFLIIRSRKKRAVIRKQKAIPNKLKLEVHKTPVPTNLVEIEAKLELNHIGFKVIHNPEMADDSFDLVLKEIIVKALDLFLIARQRIFAQFSLVPTITNARLEFFNDLNKYCEQMIPEFSTLVDPACLNVFLDLFIEHNVNTWLLKKVRFNTSVYEANSIQKIIEFHKAFKEIEYLDKSKVLYFINSLLLGELLAVFTQTCGDHYIISSLKSKNPTLNKYYDEFFRDFGLNREHLPDSASIKSFLENLKAILNIYWK